MSDYGRNEYRAARYMSIGCGLIAVFAVIFAYGFHEYYGPFSAAKMAFETRREKAATYLASPVCTDTTLRANLENYNLCEESTVVLRQNPNQVAFHAIMDEMKWCRNGVCVVLGINLSDSMYHIFRMLNWGLGIMFLLAVYLIISSAIGRHAVRGELPMTMASGQYQQYFLAGMQAAQHMHAPQKQVHAYQHAHGD